MNSIVDNLHSNIKSRREAKGWTMMELADQADINYNTVWAQENSVTKPALLMVHKLSLAFNCTIDQLIEEPSDA